jgi:hypothetical protein
LKSTKYLDINLAWADHCPVRKTSHLPLRRGRWKDGSNEKKDHGVEWNEPSSETQHRLEIN